MRSIFFPLSLGVVAEASYIDGTLFGHLLWVGVCIQFFVGFFGYNLCRWAAKRDA
jgi:hypothetical protein